MRAVGQAFCVLLLILLATASFAVPQEFQSIPTREGVQQPFWLIEPENATHIVILFAGGKGVLNIDSSGIGNEGNFLVRSRDLFANHGLVVAVVDKPTDQETLLRFRATQANAEDIKGVIAFLRKRHPGKPVWLVGTSRGTISAANVAARLPGKAGPDGIVLTSSVTKKSKKNFGSLEDVDLAAITVPTYIVHHEDDACKVTPFNLAKDLLDQLSSVKVKAFTAVSGGSSKGNPCMAKSYHGYLGIEVKVVNTIVDWIKAH